jgi:hypothetical protein
MTDPKEECELLLDSLFPFAEQMLEANGEFWPFAGAMGMDGKMISVAVSYGNEAPPSPGQVIRELRMLLAAEAQSKKYRATAVVHNACVVLPSTSKKSDAVAASLDHQSGYSVVVFYPYEIGKKELSFGSPFAQKGAADIFPAAH